MKLKTLVCLSLITLSALLSPVAHAQSFSVIHTFLGGSDGAIPSAGVTLAAGVFYGTTANGGVGGTVYQITHVGSDWMTQPISNLAGAGGNDPLDRIVFGPDGHPYGTTFGGGACNRGIFFGLVPVATICKTALCFWKEKVPYQFGCGSDAAGPYFGDLIWDHQGNIYGTTVWGGDYGLGAVYELQPAGNGWTESVLYSFSGQPGGQYPLNGLIFDSNNNLYSTTQNGGLLDFGTVFKLSYSAGVGWMETVIYNFQNGNDGKSPIAGLTMDSSGNIYGATSDGGSGGGGTLFEMTPSGDTYTFKVLYSFSGSPRCGPWGTLTMDVSGSLYGTTNCDGANGFGDVFKLTNTQNGWVYNSLYDFKNASDGANPLSNVTIDGNGNLFGTASAGGSFNGSCGPPNRGCGTVWMIKP